MSLMVTRLSCLLFMDFTNGNKGHLYGELFFLGGNDLLESVRTEFMLKDHSS